MSWRAGRNYREARSYETGTDVRQSTWFLRPIARLFENILKIGQVSGLIGSVRQSTRVETASGRTAVSGRTAHRASSYVLHLRAMEAASECRGTILESTNVHRDESCAQVE